MIIKLPDNSKVIFNFIAGSHLYGNNTPESDEDKRGVFIANKDYYYGFLNNIDSIRTDPNDPEDEEFHEIRKFLYLLSNNNPNIVEYLFVPKNGILHKTKEWDKIIQHKEYFISKKCKVSFSGYAHEQLYRIKRHRSWLLYPPTKNPERKDFGLLENRSTIPKEQIGAFNVLLAMYLEEIRSFHVLKNQILEMEETKNFKTMTKNLKSVDLNAVKTIMPISDNFLEALQKEKAYLIASKEWQSYKKWETRRNPKRKELEAKYGYDCKHASHLIRLMSEGEELLLTGNLTFPRPDADYLLAIKNGLLTYDQLIEKVDNYDENFEEFYNRSELPEEPDIIRIDNLCIEIAEEFLKN